MRAELLHHSEGHCQDQQSPARGLRVSMPNSGEEEQDFDAQNFFITLKAVAKSSRVLPEVFDSLCRIMARKSRISTRRTSSLL